MTSALNKRKPFDGCWEEVRGLTWFEVRIASLREQTYKMSLQIWGRENYKEIQNYRGVTVQRSCGRNRHCMLRKSKRTKLLEWWLPAKFRLCPDGPVCLGLASFLCSRPDPHGQASIISALSPSGISFLKMLVSGYYTSPLALLIQTKQT